MTDEKKQIEDHPLTGNDRKNLLEGLGLIVEVLNEAFAPPKEVPEVAQKIEE